MDSHTLESPHCPGCGQPLTVIKGVTICRTEDAVQPSEIRPLESSFARDEVIILEGERILNPFGVQSTRIISAYDNAHRVRFEQQKKEWYDK